MRDCGGGEGGGGGGYGGSAHDVIHEEQNIDEQLNNTLILLSYKTPASLHQNSVARPKNIWYCFSHMWAFRTQTFEKIRMKECFLNSKNYVHLG